MYATFFTNITVTCAVGLVQEETIKTVSASRKCLQAKKSVTPPFLMVKQGIISTITKLYGKSPDLVVEERGSCERDSSKRVTVTLT